ncbi:MAG TPA: fumarylacetoacetate hydrolase family protein [Steroidobacteraceae bacterium]|nr:fumarylacetoacetate hydrolase family protein [Steroidobacteraceae bacterium]
MSKLIVRYRNGTGVRWGRLQGPGPVASSDTLTVLPLAVNATTTQALIDAFEGADVPVEAPVKVPAGELLSPLTSDTVVLCQGLNYGGHAEEARHRIRKSNLIFPKASSALTGPYADIVRPREVQLLDYEVEFALVLRTSLNATTEVTDSNIGDYVAAVVLCNDVSARDTMFGATFLQWFQGKSYRTFCPNGPVLWLLDRSEVAETLPNLEISLSLNGELRQKAPSSDLIWKPAESLTFIASNMDLKSGDALLTGTPAGVTAAASEKLVDILKTHLMDDEVRKRELRIEMIKGRPFMQPGDIVTATLHDRRTSQVIGGLSNRIVAG